MSTALVSIVIPLYNTEKYIGACLESILNQTFQNFEVVVVDDCSTDSSCAIVESYREKFGGRLNLLHTEENSGCAPFPRNKGLIFSRGEYIFFMDADDMITKTALEEMYTFAKDYDADVVYCEKNYEMDADGSNIRLVCHQNGAVDKPTFESENLAERVQNLLRKDIWGVPWCKLVRRNLLIEHEIRFQKVRPCDDHLWTLDLLFFAKKFLRVPNATCLYRITETSATHGNKTLQQIMCLWLNSAVLGLKGLDKMMGKLDFFKENPQYRFAVTDYFLKKMYAFTLGSRLRMEPFAIYTAIKDEFGERLGEQDVLVASLFALLDMQEKELIRRFHYIRQLETELKKRT